MHKQILYFALGSISTLGVFNTIKISLLNIISLSSLLLFVYLCVSEKHNHNTNRFVMFKPIDIIILLGCLVFEYLALSNTIIKSINFRIFNLLSGTVMISSVIYFLVGLYCSTLNSEVTAILDKKMIYGWVRHPLCSSISLFVISSCVYAKCLGTLGFYVYKLRTTFLNRIKEEEISICKEYPNYVAYKREVSSGMIVY